MLTKSDSSWFSIARGVCLKSSDDIIELHVPRLFGEQPIALAPAEVAVCHVEDMTEPTDAQIAAPPERRIELAAPGKLGRPRREMDVVLVLAQPRAFPTLSRRARFHPEGWLYRRARTKPHDGYMFACREPDRAIALLTAHGVQQTREPYAWVAARRGWN